VQLRRRQPVRLVACKAGDTAISPALQCLRRKFLSVEAVQTVATPGIDRLAREGVRLVSADRFLAELSV
jgi:hypothetical protein